MERTDTEIVKDLQAGKAGAADELIIRYQKKVYNMAYGLTLDYNKAWDISQEVFIKVIRGINSFRGDCSLWTFLYRVTMNAFYDHSRRQKTQGRFYNMTDMEGDDPDDRGFDIKDAVSIEDDYEKKAVKESIKKAMNSLTDIQREVFMLKNLEGYKIREVAVMLKISEGTVKSHLNRAMEKVKNVAEGGGIL
jgi:RNA polymerase sigma-70 factor (ECF subfamily)